MLILYDLPIKSVGQLQKSGRWTSTSSQKQRIKIVDITDFTVLSLS